ncbi:MAG: hypothetical protein SH809_20860 [Rhodothermales bacterium]|nr:hypothetical protein [Rhodothermales bacterium]
MPVIEGIPFLGFVIRPEHVRLKRRKGIHYRRKLKGILRAVDRTERKASVDGWCNHVRYGNTVGLQKALLKELGVPFRVVWGAGGGKRIRA